MMYYCIATCILSLAPHSIPSHSLLFHPLYRSYSALCKAHEYLGGGGEGEKTPRIRIPLHPCKDAFPWRDDLLLQGLHKYVALSCHQIKLQTEVPKCHLRYQQTPNSTPFVKLDSFEHLELKHFLMDSDYLSHQHQLFFFSFSKTKLVILTYH